MTQRLLTALVAVWLLHFSLGAQSPTFSMPIVNEASEGSIISIPVTVHNFDSIVSIGMVFRWDPSVIRYIGTSSHALSDLDASDFGDVDALSMGELRLVWWLFSQAGQSLDDDAVLFKIRFRVVGPINSGTPIEFTEINPALLYEIQKVSGETYSLPNINNHNGFVAVGYTTSDSEPLSNKNTISILQNPTPLGSPIQIAFSNRTNTKEIFIKVFDLAGKVLVTQSNQVPNGDSILEINTQNIQINKLVLLLVETSDGIRYWKKAIISL